MTAIPQHVGVLGGGRMGAGIAHAFLIKGANVVVVERDDDAAAGARTRVADAVAKSAARGCSAGRPRTSCRGSARRPTTRHLPAAAWWWRRSRKTLS